MAGWPSLAHPLEPLPQRGFTTMTNTERDARIEAAEDLWHGCALAHLAQGDVSGAVACLHEFAADLDRIAASS